MEELKTMDFVKRYRVGNYTVLKVSKVLRKSEVEELRNQVGVPEEVRKHLQRSQLPYIKVGTVSGIWSVEFCCNTVVYNLIDHLLGEGVENCEGFLYHMFNMWFTDVNVIGDEEYQKAKADAWVAYMDRMKAKEVSPDEDAKILDDLKAEEDAIAAIVEMTKELEKGGEDGK